MARTQTNEASLEYTIEATPGVLAGTPTWKLMEPNTINTFGEEITTVARSPISKSRQRRKGTTTDAKSAVEFEHDITGEALVDFLEGFVFAQAASGTVIRRLQAGTNFDTLAADDDPPPAGTDSGFTHSALSAAIATGTLVFARGFTDVQGEINGLHDVITGSTTTATLVSTTFTADETPAETTGATLETCGVRGASGDITLTVSGTIGTLGTTVLDMTTLGWTVGQVIHVGGLTSTNQYATAGPGYARITSIAANSTTLDKLWTGAATDAGAGKQIDLLFGRFIRNVDVDDSDYLVRTFQFEGAFPDLGGVGTDEYEYPIGNYCGSMAFNLPLTDKAMATIGFIGLSTDDITASRKSNAATPVLPNQTAAFNTSSDIARLRIQLVDETGISTSFKSLTLTLNNNVSPENILGTLGAGFVNTGNFDVDLETQVLFTSKEVTNAIKNNTTVTMDFVISNDDGGMAVDIPSMTLGDGSREYPVNESILLNISGLAFEDATLGTSASFSLFPTVP